MSGTKIIPIPVLGKHAVDAYLLLGRRPVLVDAGTPGSGRHGRTRRRAHRRPRTLPHRPIADAVPPDRTHGSPDEQEQEASRRGETDLSDFGLAGRIMPTPGHIAGSVSVLTEDGDLVTGDLVANSFMGLIPGTPANPPFHHDPLGNLTSLRAVLELGPGRLHVGHGTPLDPERVRRWAPREQRRLSRLDSRGRLRRRTKS
ncbi:MBL fold metallo-hydrolase [Streptomyces sp. NPDC058682]|uniref:MBL fold metallo-hydrolase n=1 Tax=Streptomyces sp. NPDC058682 TaxID=3346596 RepID=UPI003667489D